MLKGAALCQKYGPHHFTGSIRDDFLPTAHPNERDDFDNILGQYAGKSRVEIPLGKVRKETFRPQRPCLV